MLYSNYQKRIKICPFCEVEQEIFIKNKSAYLTYNKFPYHDDHLLIVTKKHRISFLDISNEEMTDINKLIKKGANILNKLGYKNFTIICREGAKTGKSIKHLHYHLIPDDKIGDLENKESDRKSLSKKDLKDLLSRITPLIK